MAITAPTSAFDRSLGVATSRTTGGITELAVLAPIRKGYVPDERRTYEERLRAHIANLARRHEQGIPTELDRVTSIHFGRLIVLRPEQYLVYSDPPPADRQNEQSQQTTAPPLDGNGHVPVPIDEYDEIGAPTGNTPNTSAGRPPRPAPQYRSWLLVLVEFDGELRSYMRDIATFIGRDFDSIFVNCDDYPGISQFEPFWLWIRQYQIATDLFYATYRDMSVVRLKQLETFKCRFDAFVAQVRSPTGTKVRSMDELFDEFLRQNQQYGAGFPAPGGTYPPRETQEG